MSYSEADEFFFMSYAEVKAAQGVFHSFKVNRYELALLCAISAFLQLNGKRAVGSVILFKWLGYGIKTRAKCKGYLHGLIKRGCLHRLNYKRQPDQTGNSFAITPFGERVLELYYNNLKLIDQQNADRRNKPGYKSITVNSNNLKEALPLYLLVSYGKD